MRDRANPFPVDLIDGLSTVLYRSPLDIANSFSSLLKPIISHSALVIFTKDCPLQPLKRTGDPSIVDRVEIAELEKIGQLVMATGAPAWDATAVIGHENHRVAAIFAATDALLVLVDPVETDSATISMDTTRRLVSALWELVAISIRQQVATAPLDHLRDSRMANIERSRLVAELTDAHSTTLELILTVLRSRDTTDSIARQSARDVASAAMVQLRSVSDRDRSLSEEPVARAFERLRRDLRPLTQFGDLDVQFVEPPIDGRALPGEIAHAGRAIVRSAVLTLAEQDGVGRVRIQWDCDGSNLLIGIRDDGPGDLTSETQSVHQLAARVDALAGKLTVSGTPGWGSNIDVRLPLDMPAAFQGIQPEWGLTNRERDVMKLVAEGARNRAIAAALTISEHTVKFHVANVLRKVGATNRAELAAVLR
ncbi:LuxR C-terminal-related transcriptional regulator [Rhodococcus opacus]|uniref:LuxR C-terminal-related transcriptional regulator n=1 Tax=Rhodococcus opacus TaxID=37919 RepID=UPI002953815A|nr:LuxR C-terminal-related transcriptional regulator [Rhodococcus opacus]MDV7089144.1 LuxR C-terminal-related transcriptional regulator [Rhodococcus opacus]